MLILWALCFYQAVHVIRVVLHEVLVPTVQAAKHDTRTEAHLAWYQLVKKIWAVEQEQW